VYSTALRRDGIPDGIQAASHGCRDFRSRESVREVAVEGRSARFDATGTQHHHFICDRCGNVEDVDWYDVPKPAPRSLGKRVVRECELIFRGLCTKCARRR
jgi:Fur family peroxide stress response transcriptional regulator